MKGKQRSYLKSLANSLKVSLIVGKGGISDHLLKDLDDQLKAKELVKIKFLDNSGLEAGEEADKIIEELGAEFVSQMGSKLVIYRPSKKKMINLPE